MGNSLRFGLFIALVDILTSILCFYLNVPVLFVFNKILIFAVTFIILGYAARSWKRKRKFGSLFGSVFFANFVSGLIYLLFIFILFTQINPELSETLHERGTRDLWDWLDQIEADEEFSERVVRWLAPEEVFSIEKLNRWLLLQWVLLGGGMSLLITGITKKKK